MNQRAIVAERRVIILRILALVVVTLVWLVIGPFLWIPLIIRTLAFATFNVMATVFTGASMAPAQASLDAALGLYGRGFRAAFAVLDGDPGTSPPPLLPGKGYLRLVGELLYVTVFWLSTLSLVLFVMGISPLSLLQSRFGSIAFRSSRSTTVKSATPEEYDVSPFSPSSSAVPIASITNRGFLFKMYRCRRSDGFVRCDFTIENQQTADRLVTLGVGGTEATSRYHRGGATLVDDRGNGYRSCGGGVGRMLGTVCSYRGCAIEAIAVTGVVLPAWVVFEDVDETATTAKSVRVRFATDEQWGAPTEFRDITLTP